jgi:ABC-type phosphate transport system substrate-binding protein
MMSLSARRVLPTCVISAACIAAVAAPSAASASGLNCEPTTENIGGNGSSAQKILQQSVWNKQFNISANPAACNGTQGGGAKPTVTYTKTGSGEGLQSWGAENEGVIEENFGAKNAFVGTEIAPNKTQETEIESHGPAGSKVLTIPVAQPAIAIIIHLPKGCTAVTGGPEPGRLAIKAATLEKVFQGTVTKWSQLLNKAKFVEASKKACEKTSTIKRIVRKDGSGTTDAFKKYLNVIYDKPVFSSGKKWNEEGELVNNTEWPNENPGVNIEQPTGTGGGEEVAKVAATEGSIGYANLADARANTAFIPTPGGTGGANTKTFWAVVEHGTETINGKKVPTYADPATNGEVDAVADSNCEETTYTNGKAKFPPPTTEELWNEVTISKTQKNYAPCYLTFDLALTHYSGFDVSVGAKATAPTAGEAETVKDYFGFELSTGSEGGQTLAHGSDYLGDPTNSNPTLNVQKIAQESVSKIGF